MSKNPAFKAFLWVHATMLFLGLLGLIAWEKGHLVLFFQANVHPKLDLFFYYLTWFGDGAFLAILVLVFALYRYKYTLALLMIGIGQFALSGICKHVLFGRLPRPAAYFEGVVPLHFVEGLKVHHWYSFPSGHTLTAFGLFFFIALVNEKRGVAVVCAVLASLIGLSRVYLGLHFLEDVLAGSVLGVLLTGGIYYALYQRKWFWNSPQLNRSVLNVR